MKEDNTDLLAPTLTVQTDPALKPLRGEGRLTLPIPAPEAPRGPLTPTRAGRAGHLPLLTAEDDPLHPPMALLNTITMAEGEATQVLARGSLHQANGQASLTGA